jgi:hypothetical protein
MERTKIYKRKRKLDRDELSRDLGKHAEEALDIKLVNGCWVLSTTENSTQSDLTSLTYPTSSDIKVIKLEDNSSSIPKFESLSGLEDDESEKSPTTFPDSKWSENLPLSALAFMSYLDFETPHLPFEHERIKPDHSFTSSHSSSGFSTALTLFDSDICSENISLADSFKASDLCRVSNLDSVVQINTEKEDLVSGQDLSAGSSSTIAANIPDLHTSFYIPNKTLTAIREHDKSVDLSSLMTGVDRLERFMVSQKLDDHKSQKSSQQSLISRQVSTIGDQNATMIGQNGTTQYQLAAIYDQKATLDYQESMLKRKQLAFDDPTSIVAPLPLKLDKFAALDPKPVSEQDGNTSGLNTPPSMPYTPKALNCKDGSTQTETIPVNDSLSLLLKTESEVTDDECESDDIDLAYENVAEPHLIYHDEEYSKKLKFYLLFNGHGNEAINTHTGSHNYSSSETGSRFPKGSFDSAPSSTSISQVSNASSSRLKPANESNSGIQVQEEESQYQEHYEPLPLVCWHCATGIKCPGKRTGFNRETRRLFKYVQISQLC